MDDSTRVEAVSSTPVAAPAGDGPEEPSAAGNLWDRTRFRPSRKGGVAMTRVQQAEHEKRIAMLRTRIMREMRERGWNRLAVMPVTAGAGATTLAVDLTRMIIRHRGTRVMLIDANLGNPAIAARIGVEGCGSLSRAVQAGEDLSRILQVLPDQRNLAVLAPSEPESEASEFLQGGRLPAALRRLAENDPAHVTLIDTAPLLGTDVGIAALPLVDAILLVADARRTTAADMKECERLLVDMPPLMGVVLNKTSS
ncbi:chromosome partitioning protein [Paracoccus sp. DMF-8]|uniref:chromosome partitioning protein n=1 Tax=Paracoccus sp. DMF-8 TaxID=3019445 RepID=UPI0023E7E431|nr:chromosome partitioning protein [Paracoccus sp. DMF-8]MDF3606756.1 chromosome partitioning protein [Paracoccus sp. DMF-8]